MKIRKENDSSFIIYLFSTDLNREKVIEKIKSLKGILKLNGFYKVLVCYKSIGCFLKIIKLDDSFYKNSIDLKIEEVDYDVYFKTSDYFIIKDYSLVRYFDGEFYALVDESFDKLIEKVEFGDFVFGFDVNNSYVI